MDQNVSTKHTLTQLRATIVQKLIDAAIEGRPKEEKQQIRATVESLLAELGTVDRLLATLDAPASNSRYVECPRPIDAVKQFLKETQTPATVNEIIREIKAGGFRGGGDKTDLSIIKGINSFLTGSGKVKGYIRAVGDLIGLAEWPNSRFSPPGEGKDESPPGPARKTRKALRG